jgi:hypothetical protein
MKTSDGSGNFSIRREELSGLSSQREPIPVATRSKEWVGGRSLAGIVGSIPVGGMDVYLL